MLALLNDSSALAYAFPVYRTFKVLKVTEDEAVNVNHETERRRERIIQQEQLLKFWFTFKSLKSR